MKISPHFGNVWSRRGSHQGDIELARAPGPGIEMKRKRFCVKCGCDRDPKGGHLRGPFFFCALHPKTHA